MRLHVVSGTREGATKPQAATLRQFMERLYKRSLAAEEAPCWGHGDCLGVDAQSHLIADEIGFNIEIYPSSTAGLNRAWCDTVFGSRRPMRLVDPLPSLDRNRIMVDRAVVLVAVPKSREEEQRSGTWSTIRYARKIGRPHILIWPDGDYLSVRPEDRGLRYAA